MLINVRGAFGSGKSTIVRGQLAQDLSLAKKVKLAEGLAHKPTKADPERLLPKFIYGREFAGGAGVALGSYENNCGGLDEYSWKGAHDVIEEAIETAARIYPVVLFEGVTVSGVYGRYVDLAGRVQETHGRETVWVFTMPPAQTCLERVALRSGAGINERNTSSVFDKWRAIKRVHDKVIEERPKGVRLSWHDSTEAAQTEVESLIAEALMEA